MPQLLTVSVRTVPPPCLMTLEGEIDLLTAPQLRDQVLAVADGDLILDLSRVRLLAAAGVQTVLDLHDHRGRCGAQLVLTAATPVVRRVLSFTGVDQAVVVTATLGDAVRYLKDGSTRGGSDRRRTD
ncbi:MAG TPA: STAS domain-containing protein [Pseudonocardia sp.]